MGDQQAALREALIRARAALVTCANEWPEEPFSPARKLVLQRRIHDCNAALGEVPERSCPRCGRAFDPRAVYPRHEADRTPLRAALVGLIQSVHGGDNPSKEGEAFEAACMEAGIDRCRKCGLFEGDRRLQDACGIEDGDEAVA
nr:hypothetical protein [uncultured Rhodopila sp.]